jgi:hypothetical protein
MSDLENGNQACGVLALDVPQLVVPVTQERATAVLHLFGLSDFDTPAPCCLPGHTGTREDGRATALPPCRVSS